MKKSIKYILLGVLSLVLIVGGYIFYELKVKQYDVADEKVDEIVNEAIELELPNGSKLKLDAQGNVIEEVEAEVEVEVEKEQYKLDGEDVVVEVVDGKVIAVYNRNHELIEHETIKVGSTLDNEDTKTTEVKPAEDEKPTVATIKANYAGSFAALEGQARGRLNGLIGQAKAEYSAKVANGETINYSYFYQKYYGAATGMEATIDGAFEALYAKLQQDLTANGYDGSHASSFRTQYESAKSSLRSQLLSNIQ
ncbi:MAG: hypothetical protein ABS949_01790 [Solibacillus sp.]